VGTTVATFSSNRFSNISSSFPLAAQEVELLLLVSPLSDELSYKKFKVRVLGRVQGSGEGRK